MDVTAEAWTVIAVGVALAGLIVTLHRGLDARLRGVEQGQADLRERMATLEGAMNGFMAGLPRTRCEALDPGGRRRFETGAGLVVL